MKLDFDPAEHAYRIDGVRVPSVTQVIRHVVPGFQADPYYLQRGTAIHHGCRLLDDGKLDWSSVAPEILPRIQAWEKFRHDWPAELVANEKPLGNPLLMFAGTLDRLFRWEGKLVLADIKSSFEPQSFLQLGGYANLVAGNSEVGQRVHRGVVVEVRDDGTYRAEWRDQGALRRAEQQFLACLTIYGFMKTHNLKGNHDRPSPT